MQPHQQRVVDEYESLIAKTSALNKFLDTPPYTHLDDQEKTRLVQQLEVMERYAQILSERIGAFK